MRIFEFRDPTPIEAYVLATDQESAFELFEEYVLARGGDPDTLLWREWSIDNLDEPEQAKVCEALELKREGVVAQQSVGHWVFVTTLANPQL